MIRNFLACVSMMGLLAGCVPATLPVPPAASATPTPTRTPSPTPLPTATRPAVPTATPGPAPDLPDLEIPDGQSLVFSNRYGIYTLAQTGGVTTPLIENAGEHNYNSPSWSPTGDRLVFGINEPQRASLYLINRDGGGMTQLRDRITFGYPAWSPDGELIAYTTTAGLIVSEPNGPDLQVLAKGPSLVFPAWSPNGQQLAVLGNPDDLSNFGNFYGPNAIYIVDRDGQNLHAASGAVAGAGHLSWSPDARKIAFRSAQGCGDIDVLDLDSGSITDLTNTPDVVEQDPAWSPDGSLIAFARAAYTPCQQDHVYAYHGDQLFIMKTDGSHVTPLSNAQGNQPAWWPTVLLRAGWSYRVTRAGDYLDLRSAPALAGGSLARLRLYTLFDVLDGPLQADGRTWWHIRSQDGQTGWYAAAPGEYLFANIGTVQP